MARVRASTGIATRFEIRRGDPVVTMLELCGRQDVVVIHEADAAFEGLTRTGARLRRAALETGANLLVLPRHLEWGAGPIVALAADATDPALTVARRVAATAGRELLVLDLAGDGGDWTGALPAVGQGSLVIGRRQALTEPAIDRAARLLALPVLVVGEWERPPGNGRLAVSGGLR